MFHWTENGSLFLQKHSYKEIADMNISISGNTDVGRKRDHNEDSFIILCDTGKQWQRSNNILLDTKDTKGVIVAVADGMGGSNAGEVASALAIETLEERVREIRSVPENPKQAEKLLNQIIQAAHNRIVKEAKRNKNTKGMGTTLVIGWIVDNTVYIAWSGDSRCYHYAKAKQDKLIPFTEDHSLVWSQVRQGEITPEQARLSEDSNLILQALGDVLQPPKPDFKWTNLELQDRILLCSDGLNSMLNDTGIQQILEYDSTSPVTSENLIKAANNAGGHDNITVIVVDVLSSPPEQESEIAGHGKKKRLTTILIGFLITALLALALILANNQYHFFNVLKRKIDTVVEKTTYKNRAKEDSPQNFKRANNNIPSEVIYKPSKDPVEKEEPDLDKELIPDSAVIAKFRILLDSISIIRANIEEFSKPNSGQEREFYNKHRDEFNTLLIELERIGNEIKAAAFIRDMESSYLKKEVDSAYLKTLQEAIKKIYVESELIITSS